MVDANALRRWSAEHRALLIGGLVVVVALALCARGPRDFHEAWKLGYQAAARGESAKAETLLNIALDGADRVGNGDTVMAAAAFIADLAAARGDFARVKSVLDRARETYGDAYNFDGPHYRIENNLAVAEYKLGHGAEAQAQLMALAAQLRELEGPGMHVGLQMFVLRNLAVVFRSEGWNEDAEVCTEDLLRWAKRQQAWDGPLSPPVSQALLAYAALHRAAGRPDEASELEAIAWKSDPERVRRMYPNPLFNQCQDGYSGRKYCFLELE